MKKGFNITLIIMLLVTIVMAGGVAEGDTLSCRDSKDFYICAGFQGSAPVSSLIPAETTPLKIDIFLIKVGNRSEKEIVVKPSDFYCVTLSGAAIAIDNDLFSKIKWQGKLEQRNLPPGESLEGYLFFPSSPRNVIRSIIYRGSSIMEIKLF